MANDLIKTYSLPEERIHVINNPVTPLSVKTTESIKLKTKPVFITIGRLSHEKGYERIIMALSLLNFDFEYLIIGTGTQKENIEKEIKACGILGKVKLLGLKKNIETYLKKADLFLQGSHYEGFPNAVLEATTCGIPVIAFNAPGGTIEILKNGFNGFIVENGSIKDYAEKIDFALSHNFDKAAIKSHTDTKFGVKKIIQEYQSAILSTLTN